MIITYAKRPSNAERNGIKKEMVLMWVFHFQFSSIELLSALVSMKRNGATRFFRELIEGRYLVRFESDNFTRSDLVRLGSEGAAFLRDRLGIEVTRNPRSDELSRKVKLKHDYAVQLYILNNHFSGKVPHILTDAKIVRDRRKRTRIPDALIFHSGDTPAKWNVSAPEKIPEEVEEQRRGHLTFDEAAFWVNPNAPIAIEMEMISKRGKIRKEIFISLAYQILGGKLKQVDFVFKDWNVCALYIEVFKKTRWSQHHTVGEEHPLRSCFTFSVLDPDLTKHTEWRAQEQELYEFIRHG